MERLSIYKPVNLGNFDKCWYCGETSITTADHFYPKSLGGRLKVRCCKDCNEIKKDLTPEEWIEFIKEQKLKFPKFVRKYNRMIMATETLWERVKWSVINK